jgi:hypothetical protein
MLPFFFFFLFGFVFFSGTTPTMGGAQRPPVVDRSRGVSGRVPKEGLGE